MENRSEVSRIDLMDYTFSPVGRRWSRGGGELEDPRPLSFLDGPNSGLLSSRDLMIREHPVKTPVGCLTTPLSPGPDLTVRGAWGYECVV